MGDSCFDGDDVSCSGSSENDDVSHGSKTQSEKRKRTGGGKRGVVVMKKVIEARKSGTKIKQLSEINSKNVHNKSMVPRLGSLGYARLGEQMGDELDKIPPARRRSLLWKFARLKKDGTNDDDVQMIVDEGESIAEILTSEELHSRGPNDVLARALKKEYHGRVLTAGHGVRKRNYFDNRRDSYADARVSHLEEMMMNM